MIKLTFYKNNQKDQVIKKSIKEIIEEFNKTEKSKWEMPFERLILNFMSLEYGSFSALSDEQLDLLNRENKKYSNKQKEELIESYYYPSDTFELYNQKTGQFYNRSGQELRNPEEYNETSEGYTPFGDE